MTAVSIRNYFQFILFTKYKGI